MTTANTITALEESIEAMNEADYQMAQHLVEGVVVKLKAALTPKKLSSALQGEGEGPTCQVDGVPVWAVKEGGQGE